MLSLQVGNAVSTDRFRVQWIDLGIHTEACMTRPETCGAADGAISMWLKITNCSYYGGILQTRLVPETGVQIVYFKWSFYDFW